MKELIVHLHVYYQEHVDFYISKLNNIVDCKWDLIVTCAALKPETEAKLRNFRPDVRFIDVENVGYDLWPFIKVLKTIDPSEYEYILKLHTKNISPVKNRINGLTLKYDSWRNILVDSILADQDRFSKCMNFLRNDDRCGLVYAYEMSKRRSLGLPEDLSALEQEAERVGITKLDGEFASGTMFLARLKALDLIRNADLTADMFATHKSESHSRGSLAHIYERLLPFAIHSAGYKASLVKTYPNTTLKVFIHNLLGPVVKYLFSIERRGEGESEHKRLTVLGIPFRINKDKSRFATKFSMFVNGHIFNPPWSPRVKRRRKRGEARAKAVERYLDKYIPYFADIPEDKGVSEQDKERIFTIWFQGKEEAPALVQACWRSVKTHCTQELIVLDQNSIFEWIELPDFIIRKWEAGKIRPAHFADICRIELLYKYGGLWLDATDYVFAPMPEWLMKQDFFVFMSGERQRGAYSYVQNCFIRGRKGNYLLKAWRAAVLAYWQHEDSPIDYFVHQLLFKKVVQNNKKASELFAKMSSICQDPTHTIWFKHSSTPYNQELFNELSAAAIFQKTDFKSEDAKNPKPGTFADELIKMNL